MRLGTMLGADAYATLSEKIRRAEKREAESKRAREVNRARRLGKTVKYRREDDR